MTGSPTQLIESITQVVPVPRLPAEICGHCGLNETPELKAADTLTRFNWWGLETPDDKPAQAASS